MGIIKGVTIYTVGYLYLLRFGPRLSRYLEDYPRSIGVRFSPTELHEKQQQLVRALDEFHLFRDKRLTLQMLARHLGWPVRDVSAIISQVFDSNFNDFINVYRVQAFKDLAADPANQKYSILGLAEEAGFNSRASFYRAFKKECGLTPTEYMAQVRIEVSQSAI